MSYPVIIYSVDKIRGGIAQKVLNRGSIKSLLISKINEIQDNISKYNPAILIIDTKDTIKEEINFIRNLILTLDKIFVILLGSKSVISSLDDYFNEIGYADSICLADPLAPDIIFSKTDEILSSKKNSQIVNDSPAAVSNDSNSLFENLKQFLRL